MLNRQRRSDGHAARFRATRAAGGAAAVAILAATFGGLVATNHSHAAPAARTEHGWALADHWSTAYLWAQPDGGQAPPPHAQPPTWVDVTP